MKHKVYVDFPRSGLGNLLLIWARAKVFSHVNGIPLVTSSWWKIRWGSWLRMENRKRVYWNYFYESPILQRLRLRFFWYQKNTVSDPTVAQIKLPDNPTLFLFSTTVVDNDLFAPIRPHREMVRQELEQVIKPKWVKKLEGLATPVIAIHIRRGDFKISNPITPTAFFIKCICYIREQTEKNLPVTVFTDADVGEISDVLAMDNVMLAQKAPDILDLLSMSRSRILILSQSSTFSYWAAFLSDAIVIKPVGDWQDDLRPASVNTSKFEGKVDFDQPHTLRRLKEALQKEVW